MAQRKLRHPVYVEDEDGQVHGFMPGVVPPAWAAAKITNPEAWGDPAPPTGRKNIVTVTSDDDNDITNSEDVDDGYDTDGPPEPPRHGKGSSRDAWATYAEDVLGVDVDDSMSRDAVILAVDGHLGR